jgi:hypothetical protein
MLITFLSSLKEFFTPKDYRIVSEELEYTVDHDIKYQIEDPFWAEEAHDWDDGILDTYYVKRPKGFRHTVVPQNVMRTILRIRYYFNGLVYKAISNDISFRPGEEVDDTDMHFSIPIRSAWLVDHDDKPMRNITEKVRRYAGPRNDFHGQKVPLEDFLYYDRSILEDLYPSICITNTLGMKKTVSTLNGFITDLRIP